MPARRIGLFGGSFNPPHVAHLAVAEAAREQAGLERVLWVPAAVSPFKQDEAMPEAHHRLSMVAAAVADNPAFAVTPIEVERGGVSYTVDTARAVAAANPDADLRLLIGGDSLASFPRWREAEALAEIAPPVVFRRPGDLLEATGLPDWLARRVTFIDAPMIELSSTEIRAMLRAGRTARYLIPDAVRAYIAQHGLYGT
jgi:nicotinate-nucleotide adenylyltransferase